MKFTFTGTFKINGIETKNPYIKNGKCKDGKHSWQLFSGTIAVPNSVAFVEMFGMERDKINTFDADGNQIEINWNDRSDKDVCSKVRNKFIANIIDGERKEFITEWDMVNYLVENIDALNGKMVTMTGDVRKDFYNGTVRNRFNIRNVYVVANETKPSLRIIGEYFWNKECISYEDFTETKKIDISGYSSERIDKENKYVLTPAVLDCSKIDFDNPDHLKKLQLKLTVLGLKYEDGKFKNMLKNDHYYKMSFEFVFQNGAEAVEFSEDMLTDFQKEMIELGMKKLEDFRPKGSAYGERVTIFKLISFDARGDYANGRVDTELSAAEFENSIYSVNEKQETLNDVIKSSMNPPETSDDDIDDEDLFS